MICIFHKWDGCKCAKCGKLRDEQHDWDGCECAKCGRTRDEQHDWDGCKCAKCGWVRSEGHDVDVDGKCRRCKQCIRHQYAEISDERIEYPSTYVGAHDGAVERRITYRCINCGDEHVELSQY